MRARVDETYIEVKREWKYLYRAIDSEDKVNPGVHVERFHAMHLKAKQFLRP